MVRKISEKRVLDAEFMMGHFYQNSWGVKADGIRALNWYKRAAKKGKLELNYDGLHAFIW